MDTNLIFYDGTEILDVAGYYPWEQNHVSVEEFTLDPTFQVIMRNTQKYLRAGEGEFFFGVTELKEATEHPPFKPSFHLAVSIIVLRSSDPSSIEKEIGSHSGPRNQWNLFNQMYKIVRKTARNNERVLELTQRLRIQRRILKNRVPLHMEMHNARTRHRTRLDSEYNRALAGQDYLRQNVCAATGCVHPRMENRQPQSHMMDLPKENYSMGRGRAMTSLQVPGSSNSSGSSSSQGSSKSPPSATPSGPVTRIPAKDRITFASLDVRKEYRDQKYIPRAGYNSGYQPESESE